MQEWHLIFDSRYELIITCESAEITRNGFGEITKINWKGIKDNVPVKVNLNECKIIYYKSIPKDKDTDQLHDIEEIKDTCGQIIDGGGKR